MAASTSPARVDGLPALPGVEHRWLDVPSGAGRVRLHLAEAGAGTPVLLLHGWPQHWWCWRGVIERLRDRYRLLAPDLRGFGWSEAPGGGYGPDGFAADAVGLLDALDLARVHVIGHDWGGFSGILLGLRHPERVDRLLLCNTTGPWARLNPRVVAGLRRAWYAALLATPVLGERVVAHPGFVPWFLPDGPGDPAAARLRRSAAAGSDPAAVRRRRRLHPPGGRAADRGPRRRPHPRGHRGLQPLAAGGAPRPRRRPGPRPVRLTVRLRVVLGWFGGHAVVGQLSCAGRV
jgi:pimeloyl-ACP methyl ester carboxylesterase